MTKATKKRSVSIHAHRTSIALEPEFWTVIDEAVGADGRSLAAFITALDDERIAADSPQGLASYLRLFALAYVQDQTG
ncbi:MAG: aryl-sulfate sulfotransferase [Robiginitomaculum sp.]|nr:MAG: aryl-sulfate sulfotransferase [Robiginitomaculum sp.]